MPKIILRTLCLVTAVLCNIERSLEHEIPRRSFLSRRAIDGTRGRKYFDPNEDGAFDSYGSAGGQYDPYDHVTDLSDIRKNVPGEPGVDYPAYTTLPQTGFTCEGRSRGYYADEAAGCQVFHVCHDVLVSSFLCPIGSTFSQKLLTCDWWTKVDCSSTGRYLEVNRANYQIDDDEMIRNAYAMISLQSSAEDVTRDGLVDPDSGARIIDYSTLGGRTVTGYTPGFRRITDYAAVEATGNDLPNSFEDYPHQNDRQILNDYDRYDQRTKTNPMYHGKLHLENKGRSPYHASLIIRHDYQDRPGSNEFQDDYRRPDGFNNRLQTSYAPTVPTITTTTRRLYSPTVPTTYRPSTLAYNKLDLMVESSDHLYAQSKSPATPPTITHQNDDTRNTDLRESEAGYDDLKRSESISSPRTDTDDQNDGGIYSKDDGIRSEEKSQVSFRINVTEAIDEDEVFRQQNDKPIIRNDNEENLEDIETRDSIGIARALNNPSGRIIIQNQNPVEQASKDERSSLITPTLSQTVLNQSYADDASSSQILTKSDIFNDTNNDRSIEDYENILSSTTRSFEEAAYTNSFGDRTTSLLRDWQQKDADAVQASIVSVTTKSGSTIGRSIDHGETAVHSSFNDSRPIVDQNSSSTGTISSFNDELVPGINLEIPQPSQFLKPPLETFLINVPEETRYTSIDENSKTLWNPTTTTTEIPQFSSTFAGNDRDQSPIYDENVEEQPLIDYVDENSSDTPNLEIHSTPQVVTEISTPIPWLVSTWNARSIVEIPVTDIVPPIVDYDDGFDDFVPPNEHSYATQFNNTERVDVQRTQNSSTIPKKNDSETEILTRYNTEFQFTIRDAIRTQQEPKTNSKLPCHSSTSGRRGRHCETTSVAPEIAVSTPSVEEKTISVGTTRIPEQLISSSSTRLPEKSVKSVLNESSIFTTQPAIAIGSNVDAKESNLRTVTPRGVSDVEDPEEKTEKTVDATRSSLLRSIPPVSLKQIDKHNSPYEVSFTVKKNEDMETTADDFISRLIVQHQQPASVLNGELDDFEIVKSVEPETEIATISQVSKFPHSSHASPGNANGSFSAVNDTTDQSNQQSDSNVSMLSLLQLMAELLKLDRLPRPFSAKDLRSIELKDSFNLDFDEQPYVTASPLDYSQARTAYRNIANSKVSTFDTSKTTASIAEPKTLSNLGVNKPSFVTTNPLFDRSQVKTSFRNVNSKVSSFDDNFKISSHVAKSSPDVSSRVNNNDATERKIIQSKLESRTTQPLQKEEILEQLAENFGQPLYRGDSTHSSLVFDLPQVQRSLDFETGLPIEESKYVISETEKKSPVSSTTRMTATTTTTTTTTTPRTTTTTESVKTIVETEFVPSLGFSFDTSEGREEYVQAILEGLIDEHTDEGNGNETSVAQLTDEAPKNETLRLEQHENSKDVKRLPKNAKN